MCVFQPTQGYHKIFHNLLMASRFCSYIVHFSVHKIKQPFQQFLIQLVPKAVRDLMRLTATRTLSNVSKCHRLLGAKRSADKTMFDEHWALNSGSVFSRNSSNSFIIVRMLLELTSAKLSSRARRLMDTSGSCIQQINATIQQLCPYIIYTDIFSVKAYHFEVFPHSQFNFYDHSLPSQWHFSFLCRNSIFPLRNQSEIKNSIQLLQPNLSRFPMMISLELHN